MEREFDPTQVFKTMAVTPLYMAAHKLKEAAEKSGIPTLKAKLNETATQLELESERDGKSISGLDNSNAITAIRKIQEDRKAIHDRIDTLLSEIDQLDTSGNEDTSAQETALDEILQEALTPTPKPNIVARISAKLWS